MSAIPSHSSPWPYRAQDGSPRREYRNLRRGESCRACGRGDHCQVSLDEKRYICHYVTGPEHIWTNPCTGSHVHVVGGRPSATRPYRETRVEPVKEPEIADPDTRDKAYRCLLRHLGLSDSHREELRLKRGLDDESIEAGAYASLGDDRRGTAWDVREETGLSTDELLSVPGFYLRKAGDIDELSIAGPRGMLIPTLDLRGRITALQIRLDRLPNGQEPDCKYLWFSSKSKGGPTAALEVHHPTFSGDHGTVRLTEGRFKAEAAQRHDGIFTLSLPGTSMWSRTFPALRAIGADTVRLAFDADYIRNPHVCGALLRCARRLVVDGYRFELESWALADGKGIDDLLAGGKAPEVLPAVEAIGVLLRTSRELDGPVFVQPIEAMAWVKFYLEAGQAAAMWADSELVDAIARLYMGQTAGTATFQGIEAVVSQYKKVLPAGKFLLGIKQRAKEIKTADRKAMAFRLPARDDGTGYEEAGGCTYRTGVIDGPAGPKPIRELLARWTARIVEEINRHEAGAVRKQFAIEAKRPDGATVAAVVDAGDFGDMSWVIQQLGASWIVEAGRNVKDHLKVAIQVLSAGDGTPNVDIHTSTGWLKDGDRWIYLHAGGAIGDGRADGSLRVEVQPALSRYRLPAPPGREGIETPIKACLRVLELGKESRPGARGMAAVLASLPWRAVLGPMNSVIHFSGGTGTRKTSTALLGFAHFATGVARRGDRAPVSWSSTPGSLQRYAYDCKDSLLVVDELTGDRPTATATDFVQNQGNLKARDRMAKDFRLAPSLDPRCAVLSTGEGDPMRQSALGRMLTIGFRKDTVDVDVLSRCQADAEAGLFASAMAGYIEWLSQDGRIESVRAELAAESQVIAAEVQAETAETDIHPRHPAIVGELVCAYRIFLRFAAESGVVTNSTADAYLKTVRKYLVTLAEEQGEIQRQSSPAQKFLELISAALVSTKYYLDPIKGDGSPSPWERACGWVREASRHGASYEWTRTPNAQRLGFIDAGAGLVYLDPKLSKDAAVRMAKSLGEPIENPAQIGRDLHEAGIIPAAKEGKGHRYDPQKVIPGVGKGRYFPIPISAIFGDPGPEDVEETDITRLDAGLIPTIPTPYPVF